MKNIAFLIGFIGLTFIILSGCSNYFSDDQKIIVYKHMDEEHYEVYREVTDKTEVQRVRDILDTIEWSSLPIAMTATPDYSFIFQYKNSKLEAKAVPYDLWISENKKTIELVTPGNYFLLDEKNSAELFELLTDIKLSEVE